MTGTEFADRYARVVAAIGQACRDAGRDEDSVRLLPVSKTHPVAAIRDAALAGCARFGENRVQEMVAKAAELPGVLWVLIGHLQLNKVAKAAPVACEIQSLDRLDLAQALERWYEQHRPDDRVAVLVEVNTSGETTKSGVAMEQVADFTRALRDYPHLDVRGLMTVAHPSPVLAARGFQAMADLQCRLRDRDGGGWDELSMGMSGDFEAAIAYGSTCVRIGTALFGPRATAIPD